MENKHNKAVTIFLVVVIVLLIAGLGVMTYFVIDLNKKVESQTASKINNQNTVEQSTNTNNEVNVPKVETAKLIDVNSDIANRMINIIKTPNYTDWSYVSDRNKPFAYYYFLGFGTTITKDSFSDEIKQNIACWNIDQAFNKSEVKDGVRYISKSLIDESIKNVFGNISYTPSNFKICNMEFKYNNDINGYIYPESFGLGGGPFRPHAELKAEKIEEYSDKYITYVKGIYITYSNGNIEYVHLKNTKVENKKYEGTETPKYDNSTLEKYYDAACTFKITFAKEGENIYWVSTEWLD